jgi:hypothetical protein
MVTNLIQPAMTDNIVDIVQYLNIERTMHHLMEENVFILNNLPIMTCACVSKMKKDRKIMHPSKKNSKYNDGLLVDFKSHKIQ